LEGAVWFLNHTETLSPRRLTPFSAVMGQDGRERWNWGLQWFYLPVLPLRFGQLDQKQKLYFLLKLLKLLKLLTLVLDTFLDTAVC
jgi:hypothetical protein